jgi:hypothetical protein
MVRLTTSDQFEIWLLAVICNKDMFPKHSSSCLPWGILLAGALLGLTLPFGTLRAWALHVGNSPEQSATMTNAAGNRHRLDLHSKKAREMRQELWGALRTPAADRGGGEPEERRGGLSLPA